MNLTHVIEELVEERGLDRDTLDAIVREGMLAAYNRKYPDFSFKLETNKKTGDVTIDIEKTVVGHVEDGDLQISLRKAHHINKKIKAGDMVWVPFDGAIGRVEVLKAKQVIASRIREVESLALYEEFKDKVNTVVHGTVHKVERAGVVVKLADAYAFLPNSLTSPLDKYIVGYPLRALLKEVLSEPRNENQLILDRASADFFVRLFELEIPEVFERLVEVKSIARVAGYKTKVVVASNDPNIDPVGTCVGVHGVRIKPILKELSGEKVDILPYRSVLEDQVRMALKPAEINRIELVGESDARVWLDDDQRSLAIGKKGQNISLASKLTGIEIHLVQSDSPRTSENISFDDGSQGEGAAEVKPE